MLDFGPVLPYSNGDEQEVVILNPTAFPVEMYSLEFDERYLEEEKVSHMNDTTIKEVVVVFICLIPID